MRLRLSRSDTSVTPALYVSQEKEHDGGVRCMLLPLVEVQIAVATSLLLEEATTTLQLVSPQNETIRNSQFLADGSADPNRLKTTSAGSVR